MIRAAQDDRPAMDALGHQEKLMSTKDRDLTAAERELVIQQIVEVQARDGLSHADVGGILGCSRAVVSRVLAGSYVASGTQKLLKRAAAWLDERAERAAIAAGEYVATSISRMILTVCRRASSRLTAARIIAPAGTGKTLTLRHYAEQIGVNGILLAGGESCRTRVGCTYSLAEALGVAAPARTSGASIFRAVRRRLAGRYAGGRGTPVTILLDEATRVRVEVLSLLRSLHDDPQCRCPLVMADTWALADVLDHGRGMAGGYEQLSSRCGAVWQLSPAAEISAADVEAVAQGTAAAIGMGGALGSSALAFLHHNVANRRVGGGRDGRYAMAPGALRNVMQRLHAVADVAEALGREPAWSASELDYVADLVGGQRVHPESPCPFDAAARPEPAAAKVA